MPARLLHRDVEGRDAIVELPPQGAFIGRAADCVVRTDDATVSRKNCRIWLAGSRWTVEDLGSSNGTFVNDVRILKQELRHADVVRCGTLQVRFVEVQETQPVTLSSMIDTVVSEGGLGAAGVQIDPDYASGIEFDPTWEMKERLDAALLEREALSGRLRDAEKELEALRLDRETEGAELQRLRGEVVNLREHARDLGREKACLEEELPAQVRVAEQLRRDVELLTKEQLQLRSQAEQATVELAAREHRLEQSQEDLQRTKQLLDQQRLRLAELERTKDAGWRELNNRSSELEHLRSVIVEQERILEERRVGLVALETSMKELRQEREQLMRNALERRSERDSAQRLIERAEAAYHGINDLMSELRTNILLARDLVSEELAHLSVESGPALVKAIAVAIECSEEARGLFRSLRESFEGCLLRADSGC